MVVRNFHFKRIFTLPAKADPPLVVCGYYNAARYGCQSLLRANLLHER